MKLNEAIEHLSDTLNNPEHDWNCEECKAEHEQLLAWLIEYRELTELIELGEYARVRKAGIAKRGMIAGQGYVYFCQNCYRILPNDVIEIARYCPRCGAKLIGGSP